MERSSGEGRKIQTMKLWGLMTSEKEAAVSYCAPGNILSIL